VRQALFLPVSPLSIWSQKSHWHRFLITITEFSMSEPMLGS